MIRNIYLTIGLTISVYFIPYIWQLTGSFSSWQPSLYLHIVPVVKGATAAELGLSSINTWKIVLSFGVCLLLLEGIFALIFQLIPTKTMGLKRRETS